MHHVGIVVTDQLTYPWGPFLYQALPEQQPCPYQPTALQSRINAVTIDQKNGDE